MWIPDVCVCVGGGELQNLHFPHKIEPKNITTSLWKTHFPLSNHFLADETSKAPYSSISISTENNQHSLLPSVQIFMAKTVHAMHFVANHPRTIRTPLVTCKIPLKQLLHTNHCLELPAPNIFLPRSLHFWPFHVFHTYRQKLFRYLTYCT